MKNSLDDTQTPYPLYVGLSHDLPASCERTLIRHGCIPIRLPAHPVVDQSIHQGGHYWTHTFDKLHLFGLTQFSKFVYLDSDLMILSNLDELFERPHMSAVVAGKLVHPEYERLNSGLMVVEPQEDLPRRIGATLDEALEETAASERLALGDQDLINSYYREWPDSDLQLDEGYNVFYPHVGNYLESGRYALPGSTEVLEGRAREIKAIHFIGPVKPWMARGIVRNLLEWRRPGSSRAQNDTFVRYCKLMARVWWPGRGRRSPAAVVDATAQGPAAR